VRLQKTSTFAHRWLAGSSQNSISHLPARRGVILATAFKVYGK